MKKLIRMISVLLAISLLMSFAFAVFADDFDDFTNEEELEQYLREQQQAEEERNNAGHTEEDQNSEIKRNVVSDDLCGLLGALGIMSEAEIKNSGYATRGYVAEVLARMSEVSTSKSASGDYYYDVGENTPYGYAIEIMTDYGYFRGTGNHMFMPENNATDEQMANVLMRFSGYANTVPYESIAGELYKNVTAPADLSYSDMANMIYNMLNMKAVNLTSISDSGNKYSYDKSLNIYNALYNVEKISGIVEKNGSTGLYSESDLPDNEIILKRNGEGVRLNVGKTDIADRIGSYVTAYIKYDEDLSEYICLGYSVPENKNNSVEVSLLNIFYDSCTDTEFVYNDEGNDKEKKLKLSANIAVIYNGTYYSDADFSIRRFTDYEGKIKLIDNDGDKIYDIMVMEAYRIYRVKSVILSSKTIVFADDGGSGSDILKSVELNENLFDSISLIDEKGVKAYLEDFTPETHVAVAQNSLSAEKRMIKIIVCDKTVSGLVNGVDENQFGIKLITMEDGKEYQVLRSAPNFPDVGQSVTLYISPMGNVADVVFVTEEAFHYGIIYKVGYKRRDNAVTLHILNSSNKIDEFVLTDKLIIDSELAKDPEAIYDKLTAVSLRDAGQILPAGKYPIRYRMGNAGVPAEIDTPTTGRNESLNSLTLMAKVSSATMLNYVFGMQIPVRASTPIFVIRNAMPGSDEWEADVWEDTSYSTVGKMSDYVKSYLQDRKTLAAFKVDENSVYADLIVVVEGGTRPSNGTSLFMLSKKTDVFDEESGMILTKLYGYLGGAEKEITVAPAYMGSENITNLKPGEVVQYGTDSYGRVITARPVVKMNGNEKALGKLADTEDSSTNFGYLKPEAKGKIDSAIIYGYVLKREGDLIKIRNIEPTKRAETYRTFDRNITDEVPNDEGWLRIPPNTPVMVYDPSKGNSVYAGTYDEIRDDGAKRSIIGMRYQGSTILREIVVFNDAE